MASVITRLTNLFCSVPGISAMYLEVCLARCFKMLLSTDDRSALQKCRAHLYRGAFLCRVRQIVICQWAFPL